MSSVYKSLYSNVLTNVTRPLYQETLLVATESTGRNVPFLFTYLGGFLGNNDTTECPVLEEDYYENIAVFNIDLYGFDWNTLSLETKLRIVEIARDATASNFNVAPERIKIGVSRDSNNSSLVKVEVQIENIVTSEIIIFQDKTQNGVVKREAIMNDVITDINTNNLSNTDNDIIIFQEELDIAIQRKIYTDIVSGSIIEQINADYDNLLNRASDKYISPLGSGVYDDIPSSSSEYYEIVNPLKLLADQPNQDPVIEYILNAVKAAGKVRDIYDLYIQCQDQLAHEEKKYEDLSNGLSLQYSFCAGDTGSVELVQTIRLTPLMMKYIKKYGVPEVGKGIDSIKLYECRQQMIEDGIDPYNWPDDEPLPQPEPEPEPEPEPPIGLIEPFSVNGYYPLYQTSQKAADNSPLQDYNEIKIHDVIYYMPIGIDKIYLGDYDDWNTFRVNDSFDGIIKDWNNDIEQGIEHTFVSTITPNVAITVSFDLIDL